MKKYEHPACAHCPPVARVCRERRTDFNIVLGLCVGHDSLFYRYSEALVTTFVAKDRALAHNPVAALFLSDHYLSRVWGPERPEPKARKKKGE